MEILHEIKKPASNKEERKTSKKPSESNDSAFDDISSELEELSSTKKEDKAKEERERKLKELVQKQFIRIGDKYYKLVFKPDKNGRTQRVYMERQKSTIVDDYGRKALKWIKKCEGFCLVPSHTNFKSEIHGFFNEYYELSHVPKEGSFDTIKKVLSHVFADHIDFIMDYLTLLYMRPTQRLPIILLESKEKNTGKSTFGSLLKLIFEENAIKLGNSDFESDFNAIWVKTLCIIVDETSLDKKGIMQMIKRLSTETNKVTSNEKNKAQTQIDFIGKFFFMSNEEGKALPIEKGETRFAVFKVPTFKEKGVPEDPNIEVKIIQEVPAFLHHLKHRKLIHQERGRMYFEQSVYHTKQLYAYYEGSQSYIAQGVQEFIRDAFDMFPDQTMLHYSITDLINQLSLCGYIKKCDRQQLKKAMENDLGMPLSNKQRYEFFNLEEGERNSEKHYSVSQNNRVYEFTRDQFKQS